MLSKQHPINKLKKYKDNLSELLLHIRSHGTLYKNGIDYLHKEINYHLPSVGIEIGESNKQGLQNILDNFNDEENYGAGTEQYKFVVNLIMGLEVKMLQEKQNSVQQSLDAHKKDGKPSIIQPKKRKEYNEKKKDLKSKLHEARKEKWQAVLDQKFEDGKSKQLDKVAKEIDSSYIKKEAKKNGYNNNYCYYKVESGFKHLEFRTLEEILNRANPTYKDKKILLKWDIYQVKTLLEDKTLTKEDKKALKEIYQGLKDEMKTSKKDFYLKNDEYIKELKEARSVSPQSIIAGMPIVTSQPSLSTTVHL